MKKLLKTLVLLVLVLVALAAGAVLLLPYTVNLSPVKREISKRLSEALNATVTVSSVEVSVLPRPAISGRDIEVKGENYLVYFKAVNLYPDLYALLKKKVTLRGVTLVSPEITIHLEKKKERNWQEILASLAAIVPEGFSFSDGKLKLFRGDEFLLSVLEADGEVALSREQLLLELEAKSSFSRDLFFKVRVNPEARMAEGLLKVTAANLSFLKKLKREIPIGRTNLNASAAFTVEGSDLVVGFLAEDSKVVVNERTFSLKRLEGEFAYSKDYLHLDIKDLRLDSPLFKGSLLFGTGKEATLEVIFSETDLKDLREALLSSFPKKRALEKVFSILREGRLTRGEFKAKAKSPSRLFHLKNFVFSSLVRNGRISLKRPELELSKLSGSVSLIFGSLTFVGSGELPELKVPEAEVKIHLVDSSAPLRLKLRASGSVSEALSVAFKVNERLKERLKGLRLEGKASGKILVTGTRKKARVTFCLRPDSVLVFHERLPFPLEIDGGSVEYRSKVLFFSGVKVSFPPGTLRAVSAVLELKKGLNLEVKEARGTLKYPELVKFLDRFGAAKPLKKYSFKTLLVEVKKLSVEGPLKRFKELTKTLRIEGVIPSGSLRVPWLEEVVRFNDLNFSYSSSRLEFGPGEYQLLDAYFEGSGHLNLKTKLVSLRIKGTAKEEFIKRVLKKLKVSEKWTPLVPLKVLDFSLRVAPKREVQAMGEFETPTKARVSFIVRKDEDALRVESARAAFNGMGAEVSLEKTEEKVTFSFRGTMSQRLLKGILSTAPEFSGTFSGDINGVVFPRSPFLSRFSGNFTAKNLKLPFEGGPLVEEAFGSAEGRKVRFSKLRILAKGNRFFVTGELELALKNLRFEGTVRSNYVDIVAFKEVLPRKKEGTLSVVGRLQFDFEKVRISPRFYIEKARGDLFVYPDKKILVFPEATFCKIPVNGKLVLSSEKELRLNTYQPKGSLKELTKCLFGKTWMEGSYRLKAELILKGKDSWFEKSSGLIWLSSDSGRLYKFGALARILGLLSPIDLFKGNIPPPEKNEFPYSKLGIKGDLKDSTFYIKEAFVEGPGLRLFATGKVKVPKGELDLVVLASPFKTVDTIASSIPVIGFVLTGKDKMLISVPISVKGNIKRPEVVPLHPKAVGKSILGIFKRVFDIPAEIIK